MSEQYLGELRLMPFNFAPKGWALCNGQLLPIAQNQALFSLLGTRYGGNGQTNFALPNLQGRAPMHFGNGVTQGQTGGETTHTLAIAELPTHSHVMQANSSNGIAGIPGITPDATKAVAQGLVSQAGGQTAPAQMYGTGAADRTMSTDTISAIGGSQPHENMQPYLTLSWCIALVGIFPSQN